MIENGICHSKLGCSEITVSHPREVDRIIGTLLVKYGVSAAAAEQTAEYRKKDGRRVGGPACDYIRLA